MEGAVTALVFDPEKIDQGSVANLWGKVPTDSDRSDESRSSQRRVDIVDVRVRLDLSLRHRRLTDESDGPRGQWSFAIGKESRRPGLSHRTVDCKDKVLGSTGECRLHVLFDSDS